MQIIKNHTKITLAAFVCFVLFDSGLYAQEPFRVKYNLIVDDGNKNGSKITIDRDGQKWKSRSGDEGGGYIDLDYQHDYLISFSKQGYVTKKILISTKVPKTALKDGFNPYAFDITIFKQYDGVNLVVFNQPVAKIVYKEDADDFGYDTDYTSSVLAGIQDAEKELKKKNKEEKKNPKPPDNTTSQNTQNSTEGSRSGSSEEGGPVKINSEETNSKRGEESNGSPLKPSSDADLKGAKPNPGLPDKREEKNYVEGNKRITEITITRNGRTFVYRKVIYIWGVFYFRDNINITESLYIQEAL